MDTEIAGEETPPPDHNHLFVPGFGASDDPRHSGTLSIMSSTCTVVADDSNLAEELRTLRKEKTQRALSTFSRWDCAKGLFGSLTKLRGRLVDAVLAAVWVDDDDNTPNPEKECPYILTVSAYPCPNSDVIERQDGRCVLDTGCFQGNIISIGFAHRLGFTEFEPLKRREQDGGTVATGHIHRVSGAIHVSWFHSTSTKVYTNMRFLVSETTQNDMVIGTHSIVREQLIPPPNLNVTGPPPGYYRPTDKQDPIRAIYASKQQKWLSVLKTRQTALEKHLEGCHKKCSDCRSLVIVRDEAQQKYDRATASVNLYDARAFRKQCQASGSKQKQGPDHSTAEPAVKTAIDAKKRRNPGLQTLEALDEVIKDFEAEAEGGWSISVKEAQVGGDLEVGEPSESRGLRQRSTQKTHTHQSGNATPRGGTPRGGTPRSGTPKPTAGENVAPEGASSKKKMPKKNLSKNKSSQDKSSERKPSGGKGPQNPESGHWGFSLRHKS